MIGAVRAMLGLLLLTGCSVPGPTEGSTSPQVLACRQQAYDDPQYKLQKSIATGTDWYGWWHEDRVNNAYNDAVTNCLRQRGLAPKGGVERQRSPFS